MNVDFTTAAELLAICKKEVISPGLPEPAATRSGAA